MSNERIIEAQKYVADIFKTNSMEIALEALSIVNKYASTEGQKAMEFDINTLQEDSIKLVAITFYLGTIASNLDADAAHASNRRKYEYSSEWIKAKKENEKITAGACDQIAEIKCKSFRDDEVEKEKRASIIKAALDSSIKISDMLKKIVERLLITSQRGM
jgi:hypothetical protein